MTASALAGLFNMSKRPGFLPGFLSPKVGGVRECVLSGMMIAAAILGLAPRALPQDPPPPQQIYLPRNDEPWSYVPLPFDDHCLHTYRLFLPNGTAPAAGWPVLISFDLSAFAVTVDYEQVVLQGCDSFQTLMHKFISAGFAVVAARASISSEPAEAWQTLGGCNPPPGHGLFHPPGAIPPDLTFAPYGDMAYHMPEKDAVMIIQHVRHLARGSADPSVYPLQQRTEMAKLDHRRIAVHGASSGAVAMMWAAFGPDRRKTVPFLGLGGQYTEWTRPDAALLGVPQTWLPIHDPTLSPIHWGVRVEQDGVTIGTSGHSEWSAGNFGAAHPDDLVSNSSLYYEECAYNGEMPTYMHSRFPSESIVYVKSAPPCTSSPQWPICFPGNNSESNLHAAWHIYAWEQMYSGNTKLATNDPAVAAQSQGLTIQQFPDLCAVLDDMAVWLQAALQAHEWIEIEKARLAPIAFPCTPVSVAGITGLPPQISGSGLSRGMPYFIDVTGAKPNSPGWIVVSPNSAFLSVFAGVLVPAPLQVIPQSTNASGEVHYTTTFPSVPAPDTLSVQYLVVDDAAPGGVAMSYGLLGVAQQ